MNPLSFLGIANRLNAANVMGMVRRLKAEELMLLILIVVLCFERKCDIYFIVILLVIFLSDLRRST